MDTHLRLLDEAELVRRAIGTAGTREPAALGELYERHVRSVFVFAYGKLRNAALAEDATAQTFLQVLRALPRYQPRGVPIRRWFLTIAANVIRDMYRTAYPLRETSGVRRYGDQDAWERTAVPELRDAAAEAAIAASEDDGELERLLGALPPGQREVLRCRFVGELSIAETARCMARSEGAIRALQSRALRTLRQSMGIGGDGIVEGCRFEIGRSLRFSGQGRQR